jgi:hypothetical protein
LGIVFRRGKCDSAIGLPEGRWQANLAAGEGSTLLWQTPTAGATEFDVSGEALTVVTLPLVGGAVVVRPRTKEGALLRHFQVKITSDMLGMILDPNLVGRPLDPGADSREGGVSVYLPADEAVGVEVSKRGFRSVTWSTRVPTQGEAVVWEPTLER